MEREYADTGCGYLDCRVLNAHYRNLLHRLHVFIPSFTACFFFFYLMYIVIVVAYSLVSYILLFLFCFDID